MRRYALLIVAIACLLVSAGSKSKTGKEALEPLQSYVGNWKGVGQLKRGSTRGSWTEKSAWAWKFDKDAAAITFQSPKSKYFSTGKLTATNQKGQFKLTATSVASDTPIVFVGKITDADSLVLEAEKIETGLPARITIRMVAKGARLLVTYEKKASTGSRYLRMSEVGYTREGSGFGKGTNFVECVVTGGRGTIPVTHEGKTYYVCCGGCKDYFNEDPATALAEYRERKAEEKKK